MVVNDEHMIQVRDALKPHRGEVFLEVKKWEVRSEEWEVKSEKWRVRSEK
jgi:hypothetical protein